MVACSPGSPLKRMCGSMMNSVRRIELGVWRIGRHQNRCRAAMQARRQRHRLRMIARRKREHTTRSLSIRQRIDRVVPATKFECAHALKILSLHEHLATQHRVERRAGEDRCAMRNAFDACGGRLDVGEIEHHLIVGAASRSYSATTAATTSRIA